MPFYEYRCANCQYEISDFLSISQFKKRTICPNCKKRKLVYLYGTIGARVIGNPKTVGSLGEENYKKLPQDEKEKIRNSQKKKEKFKESIKRAKMTPEQKEKYIITGKMN